MQTANECPCGRIFTYFEMLKRTFTFNYLAFLLMRITGLALAAYLILHIYSIGQIRRSTEAFNAKMEAYNTPGGWILEYLLLFAVLYHMFNGIRVTIADFFGFTKKQSEMLWLAGVCIIIIGGVSAFVFFPGLIAKAE